VRRKWIRWSRYDTSNLYHQDLAYIHAAAFENLARDAAPEIARRLKGASIEVRRVVDVGCGAGPLTAALTASGFEVTGIDPSAELLAIARGATPAAHFINASIYDTELPACEAVVALGEPLTYHAAGADADQLVNGFFQRVSETLPAGGMLIFDVIELGDPALAARFWTSGDDWAVMVETTEDQAARTLLRNIETFRRVGELYRRNREVHSVRLFDTQALCDRLAPLGFAVETARAYGTQVLGARRRAFFATRS
jgi:SAM-dependent methyltransferase